MITGKQLAEALSKELDEGGWGMLDPYWIEMAFNPAYNPREEPADEVGYVAELERALNAVAERLNGKQG